MAEKRIMSIAALLAGIGILLFGIASLIHSLRGPDFTMPRGWSFSYTSGSPLTATPLGHAQSFTNQFSSRSYTNKLSPGDVAAILNSVKQMETNFVAHGNDFAGAVANAFATNEQFKALGIDPNVVSNAVTQAFSRPEFQKDLMQALDNKDLKQLLEGVKINQTTTQQIRIINSHP
jgi:hypothetical protein